MAETPTEQAAYPRETPVHTEVQDRNFFHLTLIIIFGIFASTLPQPQVLGLLPIRYILKDHLHCNPDQVSFFVLACGLAWYVKPLAGILTDAFPLFGTRRRHYLLISTVLAALSWLGLAFAFGLVSTYAALLIGAIIVNLFMVMVSTATGAFLVEAGQSFGATGRLTSVRSFVSNACQAINGYVGGLLATMALMWVAGINAAIVLSLFPVVYLFLREKKVRSSPQQAFMNAGKQLSAIGKSKILWVSLGFIFLFYFAPGFSTLQFFRQSNELHFAPTFIGFLGSVGGIAGLASAVVYGFGIKRLNIRTLLFVAILINGLGTLLYLPQFYTGHASAIFIDGQSGFFGLLAEVGLLDLAARSTPVGAEGLGYGLILSVRNIAVFGADYLGSKLHDLHPVQFPFSTMVLLNAGTTLLVAILLPFLPAAIARQRDKAVPSEPDPELRPAETDI